MNLEKYPTDVKHLNKLTLCSNTFSGYGEVLVIQNFAPLIIGDGIVPEIWVTVKIGNDIIPIIENNKTTNQRIKININKDLRKVTILGDQTLLIEAKMTNDKECVVNKLDLRPVGLNLYGDINFLSIADRKINSATFENNGVHIFVP